MTAVSVIDYGVGNLLSVTRAFQYVGAEVILTNSPEAIENAERLVLPGVGAFADGMAGLRQRGLIEPIKKFAGSGRPFLGICLGMQMMMEASEEFGSNQGLGLVPGKVVAIPPTGSDGYPHKIPQIGWNSLLAPSINGSWENTILKNIPQGSYVYFVHSFMAVPDNEKHRLADYLYDGHVVTAAIRSGNLYGCQFHPEKSGKVGLQVIKNFLAISL
ncbi:MAG: imidazole glycerol phosphate synthase subunit HisH [Bacillota bacterium]